MTKQLALLAETDPSLKKVVPKWNVDKGDVWLKDLAEQMHTTRRSTRAVGLAANQVGLSVRMFVMGNEVAQFTCINPEIIEKNEKIESGIEGCLSFPKLVLKVKRPTEIKVKYLDEDLKEQEHVLKGLFARVFQHELDHLDGITFTNRVSKLALSMAKKKREKISK